MARQQTPAQKKTVERVMHEFKHGGLRTGGDGPTVRNPKQAIAIALHEAGASNGESPKANRKNLARTKERRGETARDEAEGTSKAALYAEARKKDVPGRSKMSKAQLRHALDR